MSIRTSRARALERTHREAGQDAPAHRLDVAGIGTRHRPVVDDPRARCVQRASAVCLRLDLAQLVAVEHAQPLDTVRDRTAVQLLETLELRRVERDDQLPAGGERDLALGGVALQHPLPFDAEAGLERARLVVDPRVEDAGVVAGLVSARRGLLLEHGEPERGALGEQGAGGGEPDDPGADDDHVEGLVAVSHAV